MLSKTEMDIPLRDLKKILERVKLKLAKMVSLLSNGIKSLIRTSILRLNKLKILKMKLTKTNPP
jgi:hypothetical protein